MFFGIRFAGRAQPALVGMSSPFLDCYRPRCRRDIGIVRRNNTGLIDNLVKRFERLGSRGRKFFRLFFLWLQSLDWHDDARGYLVAVIVSPDLDHLKPAGESVTLRPLFHKFNSDNDVVRSVAFDGVLRIDGAHKRAMAARAGSFVAAM